MNKFRDYLLNIFTNTTDTKENIEKRKLELHQYVKDFFDSSSLEKDENQIQLAMRRYILHKFSFLSDIYNDFKFTELKITPAVLEHMGIISHENFKNFNSNQLENFILFEGNKKIEPKATKDFKKLFSYRELINQKLIDRNPKLIFNKLVYHIQYNQYDDLLIKYYDHPRYQFKIQMEYWFWILGGLKTRKEKNAFLKEWNETYLHDQTLKIYKDVKEIFTQLNAESSLYMCLFESIYTGVTYHKNCERIYAINHNYDKKEKVRDNNLGYVPVMYEFYFKFWNNKNDPGSNLWTEKILWEKQTLFLAQILGIQSKHTDTRKDNGRIAIGFREYCTGCGHETGRTWNPSHNKFTGYYPVRCNCNWKLEPEIFRIRDSIFPANRMIQVPWDIEAAIDDSNAKSSKSPVWY